MSKVRPLWVLSAIALVPALHAVIVLGRLHPDEVYQALEPAWFKAHGYGILAWEWHQGLRNWALPYFLAALLKVCDAVGITNPRAYRTVLEIPQYALHLAAIAAVYRYLLRRLRPVDADAAQAERASLWALFGAALFGLHALVIYFAGRTMSESISASFLVLGIEALDRPFFADVPGVTRTLNSDVRAGLMAGLWLGLSVVARYGSAVVVVVVVLYLLVFRKWRAALFSCIAGGVVAVLLGLLDLATWGDLFHSLKAYLEFNVSSGGAARMFGGAPWTYYLPWVLALTPFWAWVGFPVAVAKARPRVPVALVAAVVYFAALGMTEHKEWRFLYPGIQLFALACVPGLVRVLRSFHRPQVNLALAAGALALSFVPFAYREWPDPDLRGDQIRAIVEATRGDATGLLIVNEGVWGAGGFFYIGKNIPWTVCDFGNEGRFIGAVRDPRVNRAVTFEDRAVDELKAAGFHEVKRIGRETIFAR